MLQARRTFAKGVSGGGEAPPRGCPAASNKGSCRFPPNDPCGEFGMLANGGIYRPQGQHISRSVATTGQVISRFRGIARVVLPGGTGSIARAVPFNEASFGIFCRGGLY